MTRQIRLAESEHKQWRTIARLQMPIFLNLVRAYGEPQYAPEMPVLTDGLQGFIKQPCRVLFMYIPPWAGTIDADQFILRFDTCYSPVSEETTATALQPEIHVYTE